MSAAEKKEERSLVRKLAEVMGEVERVAKNGRNDFHKYDYATESDITAAVREHMASRHLLLVPSVEKTEWEKVIRKNGETKLCTLTVKYRLMDGDSGEQMEFTVLGQGEDAMDKGTYKAMTGATKYALMKLFLMPTGDDPEKDSEHRYAPGNERPAPVAQAPRPANSPPPSDSPVVPFGKTKGKRLSEIDDADLEYHLKAATKAAALNDPKWHAKNEAWLKACQAETSRRIFPATGQKSAPVSASPRQASLPVANDDEGEEVVTPLQAMWRLGREHGKLPKDIVQFALGAIGKATGFTHDDVARVREALGPVAKR